MVTKEFGAKIPKELYDEFRDLFPMYGATTWFINNSLKQFIEMVRDNPDLQEVVSNSIEIMLETNRAEIAE